MNFNKIIITLLFPLLLTSCSIANSKAELFEKFDEYIEKLHITKGPYDFRKVSADGQVNLIGKYYGFNTDSLPNYDGKYYAVKCEVESNNYISFGLHDILNVKNLNPSGGSFDVVHNYSNNELGYSKTKTQKAIYASRIYYLHALGMPEMYTVITNGSTNPSEYITTGYDAEISKGTWNISDARSYNAPPIYKVTHSGKKQYDRTKYRNCRYTLDLQEYTFIFEAEFINDKNNRGSYIFHHNFKNNQTTEEDNLDQNFKHLISESHMPLYVDHFERAVVKIRNYLIDIDWL